MTNEHAPDQEPQITIGMEEITPEIAAEYLTHVGGPQRPLSPAHLQTLIRKANRGEFKVNAFDAVGFGVDGNLQNGRHRLEMVVATGVTIFVPVARNCPLESFYVIDDGKSRTVADVLQIKGERQAQALAETLETTFRYLTRMANPYIPKPTKGQSLDILVKHADIRDSLDFCIAQSSGKITDRGMVIACHWLWRQIDPERADTVARKYIVGLGFSGDNDPFFVLREVIIKDYLQDKHPPMTWQRRLGFFTHCWNNEVHGNEVKKLRASKTARPLPELEGFPKALYWN